MRRPTSARSSERPAATPWAGGHLPPPRRQRKQPSDAPPDAPVADGTEMEVETVEERMQEPGTEAEMEE